MSEVKVPRAARRDASAFFFFFTGPEDGRPSNVQSPSWGSNFEVLAKVLLCMGESDLYYNIENPVEEKLRCYHYRARQKPKNE